MPKETLELNLFPENTTSILHISFTTYTRNVTISSNLDLGTIALAIDTNELDEIELVGEQTQVEIRLDKRIYNVGKDITVRGGKVPISWEYPSITVDMKCRRGNNNVRILINGKVGLIGISGPDSFVSCLQNQLKR